MVICDSPGRCYATTAKWQYTAKRKINTSKAVGSHTIVFKFVTYIHHTLLARKETELHRHR